MGNVARRPDGKWRARYRDADRREHSKHFDRKRDAELWLSQQETALYDGTWTAPDKGRMTFGQWFTLWAGQQIWAKGTRDSADVTLRTCDFAGMRIGDVQPSTVRAWIKRLDSPSAVTDPATGETTTRPGLAPNTILIRFNMVRSAFKAAVQDRIVPRNPTDGVRTPRRRRNDAAMVLLTTEQVRAAMEAVQPWFRAFVAVGAFAGLRLGEIAGLRVSDVDFLRGTITVARNVQGNNIASLTVGQPKHGSERVVYVPRQLTDLLAAHVAEYGVLGVEQWLFHVRGHLYGRGAAGDLWRRGRERAGLPDEATPHDLRHSAASFAVASGASVKGVQRMLGHKSAAMTLDVYADLFDDDLDLVAEAIDRAVAVALSGGDDVT